MITEIATFSLLTPADLSDPSSPTTSIIRAFLSAILAADGGAHAAFFGQSVEKADTVVLFIDWDSAEAHRQFLASPAYAAIAAPLLALINPTTPVQILHVPAIPHALLGEQDDINVAEVVFFYIRSSLTAAETANVMATLDTLRPALEKSEAKGVCEGWAEEEGVEYGDSDGREGGGTGTTGGATVGG
ncbi:hypothetical protein V495_07959, partial [Pseudogymnoascus sp. VKM F-4514 (FW-929)]